MAGKKYRLLVSFDVPKPRTGNPYTKVDNMLKKEGDVIKVFHQLRMLTTSTPPSQLTKKISAIIGEKGAVLVVNCRRPFRFTVGKSHPEAKRRAEINEWFKASRKEIVTKVRKTPLPEDGGSSSTI